jgi:hypothetical protein
MTGVLWISTEITSFLLFLFMPNGKRFSFLLPRRLEDRRLDEVESFTFLGSAFFENQIFHFKNCHIFQKYFLDSTLARIKPNKQHIPNCNYAPFINYAFLVIII